VQISKCLQAGCEFGPNGDPGGPSPRPPPSGNSGYSKSSRRYPDTQRSSNIKQSATSRSTGGKSKNANHNATEGLNKIDEADTDTEEDLSIWRKEYETWKDVTCACGFGYYTLYGEWISGEDVRAGKAPPKPTAPGLHVPIEVSFAP
jgi:hypothetical protein